MQAQIRGLQISRGGLRFLSRCAYGAADPAPQVNFIGEIEGQGEGAGAVVCQRRGKVGLIGGVSFIDNAGRSRDGWKLLGPVEANHGARLAKPSLRHFQVLVGSGQLLFQCVELWVAENLPPVAAECLIAWLSGFPSI